MRIGTVVKDFNWLGLLAVINYANGNKIKANVYLKVFKSSTSVPSLLLQASFLMHT